MDITIFHNPKCSKSRQTLQLLVKKDNINLVIRKYLETPADRTELTELSEKLNMPFSQMVRTKESEFKEFVSDKSDNQQCLEAMIKFPKVMERPIVIGGDKAVFGRPPENINMLFK